MNSISAAFIGGCVNKQSGLKRDELYFSILKNLLCSKNIQLNVSLGTYLSFDQLLQQTISLVSEKRPDVLFVFIRPFPLMPLNKLFVKYEKESNAIGWSLHPELFGRRKRWKKKLTERQSEMPFTYKPKSRFSLRDANLLLGVLLGLNRWAVGYLEDIIAKILIECEKRNIRLCLLSPPKSQGSLLGNFVCTYVTKHLGNLCNNLNIEYIDINVLPNKYFERDKIHLNKDGHIMLGQMTYGILGKHKGL